MLGVGDYIDNLVETMFGASFEMHDSVMIFLLLCILIVQILRTIVDRGRGRYEW